MVETWGLLSSLTQQQKPPPGHEFTLGTGSSSTLSKMENAVKAGILCSVLRLFFSGNQIFATDIYANIWAVKVHGGEQDAKNLALKHGLFVWKTRKFKLSTLQSLVWDSRIHWESEEPSRHLTDRLCMCFTTLHAASLISVKVRF